MNFFKNHGKKIFFILTVIALLIFIGYTVKRPTVMSGFESKVGDFFAPGNKLFGQMGSAIGGFFGNISGYLDLDKENEALRAEIAKLKEENLRLTGIVAESEVLTREAELLKKTAYSLLEARLIGRDKGERKFSFTIDKGSKDGVKLNQTVVSAVKTETFIATEGLVGKVIDVGDTWAKVEAITDGSNSVSFRVSGKSYGGMLKGSEKDLIEGYMFEASSKPKKGDECVSSGLGGVYPKGILIGEIEEVKMSSDELTKRVLIKPATDFLSMDRCFVIIGDEK